MTATRPPRAVGGASVPGAQRDARPASVLDRMRTSRVAIWVAFVVTHLLIAGLDLGGPGAPMGDVEHQYHDWVHEGLVNGLWIGIDQPWVYPVLAILPMIAAAAAGFELYTGAWLALVLLLDAVALAVLLRRPDPERMRAAWWWTAFLALLGPIALARIDSVTVPIAIVGLLCIAARPALGTVLLTVAAWMKVWPVALLLAAFAALQRDRPRILGWAATASAVIVLLAFGLGSGPNVLSFVTEQTSRGLQIEAPIASPWMWGAVAHVAESVYNEPLNTFEVQGPGSGLAAALMTPVLAAVVLGAALLTLRAARAGAAPMPLLALAGVVLVAALIACNKVGSPQYIAWLSVPLLIGLVVDAERMRLLALLGLATAACTQLLYPYLYGGLIHVDPRMVAVVSVRNALVVALLVVGLVRLWRAGAPRLQGGAPARRADARDLIG